MRLLKTHSHTSNRLAMEPGTPEENQSKETQTLQQSKRHPSKPCRVPPVWRGGAAKALEHAACRRCGGGGRKGSTANQPQKRYYGESSPRRYGGEYRRLQKRGVMLKTSRGPSARRGVRRGNDKCSGWKVATSTASPVRGKSVETKKQSRTNTTHKLYKMTHRPVHIPVPSYARTGYPGFPPGSGRRRASEGRN